MRVCVYIYIYIFMHKYICIYICVYIYIYIYFWDSSDCSIKWNGISSKQRLCHYYFMDVPHGRWQNVERKRLTGTAWKYYKLYWTNRESNTSQNSSCTATYLLSPKLKTNKTCRTNSLLRFSDGPFHMDVQVLADEEETTFSSSEQTQDGV